MAPPSSSDGKMHPAITVTNVRNFISITLEMESGQYNSWAELFRIHCRAFEVLGHIIPPKTPIEPPVDKALWSRLDAIVLQWIHGTISNDLLHTIITPDTTVARAWSALENIFQDNKNSQVVYLEHQFANTRIDNFSNVTAYCQSLKMLADQLANVGAPVTNQRLVLQLIAGLNEAYDGVAMLLQGATAVGTVVGPTTSRQPSSSFSLCSDTM
ncbi:hypothetical protein CASFOL_020557 [Castilleja foliolosa]|uniref:Uncharacterized protein n=1 Tax=Castilleja foliolosa TaxID=1961234 RepID=A0ABD3D4Y5_9LAMI